MDNNDRSEKEMSKRVYISGKIGEEVISEATRQKFAKAEGLLEAKGWKVTNPASRKSQALLKYRLMREESKYGPVPDFYSFALVTDIVSIWRDCDAVYFLKDWKKSLGATCEHAFAVATGKRLLFADRFSACEYLVDRMYKEVRAGNPPGEYLELSRSDAEIAYAKKHLSEVYIPMD